MQFKYGKNIFKKKTIWKIVFYQSIIYLTDMAYHLLDYKD